MKTSWRNSHFNVHDIQAYHGSSKLFENFDLSYLNKGKGDGGMYGPGFYFTEDTELAKIWNESGYLYLCQLHFDNPYVMYGTEEEHAAFTKLIKADFDETTNQNTYDMTEFFRRGYDSVVSLSEKWENQEGNRPVTYSFHDQYVAFFPEQIKILKVQRY